MNKDNQNNQSKNEENKEIKYEIRSMESDLKNSDYKKGAFLKNEDAYSQQENQKVREEEKRKAQEKRGREKQEEERRDRENRPNPFLENIKKDEKNIFTNPEDEKEEKRQPSKNPKQKPSSLQKTTMEQESPKKTPFLFLGVLIAVSLTTAGAGFYYYFFVLNQEEEPKETVVKQEPQEPQEPKDKEDDDDEEEEEEPIEQEEEILPDKFNNPDEIITLSQDETLIKKIQSIQNISQDPKVYQFKNKEDFIEAKEFLSALSIRVDQEDAIDPLGSVWLIMHKIEGNQTRSAVVFEMETESKESTQATFKEMESSLPDTFKPLYQEINQISVSKAENPEFKNSTINENFRYFNFNPNDETVSIDWGILNNNLLVISTSKPTAEAVIEIANQENLSENTKSSSEENNQFGQFNQETDQ